MVCLMQMKICKLEVCDVKSLCYESLYTNMHNTHISGNIETFCKLEVCDVKSSSLCLEVHVLKVCVMKNF